MPDDPRTAALPEWLRLHGTTRPDMDPAEAEWCSMLNAAAARITALTARLAALEQATGEEVVEMAKAAAKQLRHGYRIERDPDIADYVAVIIETIAPTLRAQGAAVERERIIQALREEADVSACTEDANVVADCADLIEHDFDYEAVEAARIRTGGSGG